MDKESKKLTIKERIELQYGSINRFIDCRYYDLKKEGISRTHIYALLNNTSCNPTVDMMVRLSKITGIPYEDIANEYSMRYRNERPVSEHAD